MKNDPFEGLTAFLAVAQHRSFTVAAAELGITPTALSQKIKLMERRLGVVLFQRTTRRVALTEAGAAFFARVSPVASEVADALVGLGGFRDRPRGTLRLTVPRVAAATIVEPLVPRMREAYPDVALEISLDDAMVDLIAGGYDAGIRIGDAIERDMVGVRLTRETAWSIVGSPGYFKRAGRPKTPDDLPKHEAVRQRMMTSGVVYRWELERGKRTFTVDMRGDVVVDDVALLVAFARDGLGLAYVPDMSAWGDLSTGKLERVLVDYVVPGPGLHLYFPERTQTQPKLRAFVDVATAWAAEGERTGGTKAGSPKKRAKP